MKEFETKPEIGTDKDKAEAIIQKLEEFCRTPNFGLGDISVSSSKKVLGTYTTPMLFYFRKNLLCFIKNVTMAHKVGA